MDWNQSAIYPPMMRDEIRFLKSSSTIVSKEKKLTAIDCDLSCRMKQQIDRR